MNSTSSAVTLYADSPRGDAAAELPVASDASTSRWLDALCLLLLGYALFGKGFAYLGISSLFVGEMVLLWGLMRFFQRGNWRYVLISSLVWPLLALALWGTATTLPYLKTYGLDSIRDAMIWGYAAFAALVMGELLSDPQRLRLLINRYTNFAKIYLLTFPATYVVSQLEIVPSWPWADVAMIDVKVGDVLVHLAGVFALGASGLGGRIGKGWMVVALGAAAIMGASSRGGLVAFMLAYAICLVYRPFNRFLWAMILAAAAGLLLLATVDLRLEVPGKDREFSAEQIVESVNSVFERSADRGLDSTKQWRLRWWTDIVNYTWRGEYFWQGKGFGINLADDDGYQGTQWEGLLRSPHNGHLTMLARAGVPGFVLWVFPQLLWLVLIVRSSLKSQAHGDGQWLSLFVFLLAYWAAFITRATFDVYFEGPVGGVWFWTVYGVGLSAVVIYHFCPQCLRDLAEQQEDEPDTDILRKL
ncbi:MAG: O-antigen ligase family protein [Planctomycetales bacterium]|nr:O-antigen ligase family protein [Planctomycetales bacterium]